MSLVIRSEAHGAEWMVGAEPLTIGSAPRADVSVAGPGVEAIHVRVGPSSVEAVGDCEVSGVPLKAGARRALVPCSIRVGHVTVEVAFAEVTKEPTTRELVDRALAGPGDLWPYVVTVEGASPGSTLVLREERDYRVGRGPMCDLVVEDIGASREHLEIVRRGNDVFVRDLGSTGGSWLGRQPLEVGRKARWIPRRMMRIGSTVLALVVPPGAVLQPLPPAPAPTAPPASVPTVVVLETTETDPGPVAPIAELRPAPPRSPPRTPAVGQLRVAPAVALLAVVVAASGALAYLIFAGN